VAVVGRVIGVPVAGCSVVDSAHFLTVVLVPGSDKIMTGTCSSGT